MTAPAIQTYWQQIYAHLRARCGCAHHEAEDLTQELFTRLVSKGLLEGLAERFATNDELRNYLFASARNTFRDRRRTEQREKRGGGAVHVSVDDTAVSNTPVTVRTPATEAESRELHSRWESEADAMEAEAEAASLRKRTLFANIREALHPGERFTHACEVADSLGLSAVAVRVQLHRWRGTMIERMRRAFPTAA